MARSAVGLSRSGPGLLFRRAMFGKEPRNIARLEVGFREERNSFDWQIRHYIATPAVARWRSLSSVGVMLNQKNSPRSFAPLAAPGKFVTPIAFISVLSWFWC